MSGKVSVALAVLFGMVVGNFLYQFFAGEDYARALERSVFQIGAIVVFLVAMWASGE